MTSSSPSQLPLTTLPLNTMTPYVRAHLDVAGDTLHWDSWWTVLGFIPVRRDRLVLPLAEVADTRSRTWVHWDRLLVGLALVAAAPAWPGGWVAVPMLGAAGSDEVDVLVGADAVILNIENAVENLQEIIAQPG